MIIIDSSIILVLNNNVVRHFIVDVDFAKENYLMDGGFKF